eukprot:Rhum_TRINITY_DN14020_c1_g4::Rhum_TRINITY_DN14020_c1_g4_i1::g.67577::m.67577
MGRSAKEPAAAANGAAAADAVETKGTTTATRDGTGDPPPAKKARVEAEDDLLAGTGLVVVESWHPTPSTPPRDEPKDFDAMTKYDLVEECRDRRLKGTGTKAQIVQRLKDAQYSETVEKSKGAKQEAKSKSGQVKQQREEKGKVAKKAPELTAVGVALAELEDEVAVVAAQSDLSHSQLADECHARGLKREGTLMQLIYRLVGAKPRRRAADDSVTERARMFVKEHKPVKFANRRNHLLLQQKKEGGETLADDE